MPGFGVTKEKKSSSNTNTNGNGKKGGFKRKRGFEAPKKDENGKDKKVQALVSQVRQLQAEQKEMKALNDSWESNSWSWQRDESDTSYKKGKGKGKGKGAKGKGKGGKGGKGKGGKGKADKKWLAKPDTNSACTITTPDTANTDPESTTPQVSKLPSPPLAKTPASVTTNTDPESTTPQVSTDSESKIHSDEPMNNPHIFLIEKSIQVIETKEESATDQASIALVRSISSKSQSAVIVSSLILKVIIDGNPYLFLKDDGSNINAISQKLRKVLGKYKTKSSNPLKVSFANDDVETVTNHYENVPLQFANLQELPTGFITYQQNSFAELPLPKGIDGILGMPWHNHTDVSVQYRRRMLSFPYKNLEADWSQLSSEQTAKVQKQKLVTVAAESEHPLS